MVYDVPKVKTNSIKILHAIAALFGFRIISSDVRQAYLRCVKKLMRNVLIKPPKELCLKLNQLVQLLNVLHAPDGSSIYRGLTLKVHIAENVRIQTAISDADLTSSALDQVHLVYFVVR